jgi:Family of unknown function (DUF5686)/CarboxypepD_reg-like domain
MCKRFSLFLVIVFLSINTWAQETIVKGRITDQSTNDAIPFANIKFVGTTIGTSADFDGYFTLKTSQRVDSIRVDYLGYKARTKKIKRGQNQVINFQLQANSMGLQEVVIKAGVNPAIQVIKDAQKNREKYNKASLKSYQYENYAKIQIDIDNISENIKKRKILKPVTAIFDSLDVLAGEDSKANLPMFYSENISDVYYISEPFKKKKEIVKASKLNAVGLQDGILTSQFTGNSFEEYNFNQNKLFVFNKEFQSPIGDNAFLFYEFYLTDTVYLNGYRCYQIKVKPKNNKDLLFTGFIWVTDSTWAIKQVNLEIPKYVNINFLERVQVQQELEPTTAGAWLPMKSRLIVDFADVSKKSIGLVAKVYNSIKYVKVNEPLERSFYESPIKLNKDALIKTNDYWTISRHDKLTATDVNVYNMIDTIKSIPRVKTGVNIFYTIVNGHYTWNKVDIGPYLNIITFNNIEGYKLRLGGRTNINFSNEWILRGYIAYGFRDQRFKYNAQVERIISRDLWTKVGVQRREDIDQVGVTFRYDDSPIFGDDQSSLYATTSQITRFALFNRKTESRFWIERELKKGITTRITLQNIGYKHYFANTLDSINNLGLLQRDYITSEAVIETRFAWNELQVLDNNRRYVVSAPRIPVVTLQYVKGIKNVFNSDLNYSRFNVKVNHRMRLGFLGYSRYIINAGKVFSNAPFTLLQVHRGNQTPFFAYATFNLMNYNEFISDEYVSIDYVHHFEGLFFNRVPLIRQLKWRELVSFRAVYGTLTPKNQSTVITNSYSTLTNKPYLEAGFGVTSIFRIIRVDFIYRLSYTNDAYKAQYEQLQRNNGVTNPYTVNRFGVKFSAQFNF